MRSDIVVLMQVRVSKARGGVAYVYIVESYRDEAGKPRQRTVEKHGRLDALERADPHALENLRARAKELTAQRQGRRGVISYDTAVPSDGAAALNMGWQLVEAVVSRLGVGATAKRVANGQVADVLTLLVCSQTIWPGSKKAAIEHAERLMAGPQMPGLARVYRALDDIAAMSVDLQQAASKALGRGSYSLATVDYDVTNYFFHIDDSDDEPCGKTAARGTASRQRGFSKENRPDPIIQMGLFLDSDGIAVSYRLFDGNVPDTSTLPAALSEFKATFNAGRVVVVADKAMSTRPNLGALRQNGDGWIVSTSARTATKTIRDWLGEQAGWHGDDRSQIKSMITTRSVPVTEHGVDNLPKKVTEKIVAHWSADNAARDRQIRDDILARAAELASDEAKYRASNKRGVKKYITAETIDPETGELHAGKDTHLSVDTARADAEAVLDGYQIIRTSETHLPDSQILDRYRQLWRIEQTFRVSKTDLHTRPIFVRTPAHIEAHFAICFFALLATRLLERWTALPSGQLLEAIRDLDAIPIGDGIYRIIRPARWDTIDTITGASMDQTWASLRELRQWRRHLATAAKTTTFTTSTNP